MSAVIDAARFGSVLGSRYLHLIVNIYGDNEIGLLNEANSGIPLFPNLLMMENYEIL